MGKIFISYRRIDTDFAHRIADKLREHLHAEVFIDSRLHEEDFDTALDDHVKTCSVFVSVVTVNTFAPDRIHREEDWIRREIRTAFLTSRPIALAIRYGSQPPNPDDLPEDLREITRKQAVFFYPQDFDHNAKTLAEHCVHISNGAVQMKQTLPSQPSTSTPIGSITVDQGVMVMGDNSGKINVQTGPSRRAELTQEKAYYENKLKETRRKIGELSYVPQSNMTVNGVVGLTLGGLLLVIIGFSISPIVGFISVLLLGAFFMSTQSSNGISPSQRQEINQLEANAKSYQHKLQQIAQELQNT